MRHASGEDHERVVSTRKTAIRVDHDSREPRVRIEGEGPVRSRAARNPETPSTRNTATEREALRPKMNAPDEAPVPAARMGLDALTKRRSSVTESTGEEGGSARTGGGRVLAPFSSIYRESTKTKICVNRLSLS